MNIVKGVPPETKKLKVRDLSIGTVYKFAEPWSEGSENQVFVVFSRADGTKSSLNLTESREIIWGGFGHEDNLATVLEATLTII